MAGGFFFQPLIPFKFIPNLSRNGLMTRDL